MFLCVCVVVVHEITNKFKALSDSINSWEKEAALLEEEKSIATKTVCDLPVFPFFSLSLSFSLPLTR